MKQILSQSFTPESAPTFFRQQSERPNLVTKQLNQKECDANELYALIVNNHMIKEIRIVKIFKEEDRESIFKNHIVNYVIQIRTDYIDYTIPKRYSEFEKLYESVNKFIQTQLPISQKKMPKFPSKKVIQTNSRKTIAKRQEMLEKFLQYLLQYLDHTLYVFLDFLKIKEQFQKGGFDQNVKMHQFSKDENALCDLLDTSPKKIQPNNQAEQMIFHYLWKLNETINERGKIFQYIIQFIIFRKMEKYYFGKIQQISPLLLKVLLIGDDERELQGIMQMLSIQTNDMLSHISCIHGFQFLRKILEYDYNPSMIFREYSIDAEQAIKLLSEISIKQFRTMKIQSHICGQQKLCKQDSLMILHKYIQQNQLKNQMISYLLVDDEAIREYDCYVQTYLNKMNEEVKQLKDSNENLQELLPTKSNSIEHAILEQDPTLEQLVEISQMNLNWKYVQECDGHTMYHLQGQFVKTIHPIKCSMDRAIKIFSDLKQQWFHGMIQKDVLEQVNENKSVIVEYYVWEDKSTFKKMAFVSDQEIVKVDDFTYQITIVPNSKQLPNHYKLKCDQKGQKMSLILMKSTTLNHTEVVIYQNIMDPTFRTALTPVILKEIPWFNNTITKLKALL
ncbi:unnamed protein product (macronuclear) [Paramecium tetraurelia]|uniref:PX domain-containing protein n=1 Tax=Paramecium tetraurelia TaxID=5888 RepID=A0C4L6_PARTE|nr:uncharacterized protein GSPATT00006232001 [Paramecium tetraurelia]CAK65733.1 unnamed protein product [Paramecium tetraurelia]|eukprot:XP_001433130.1 hypothetical protein (macronuclear) [Paramecium tetraurelia strain d4-2]